MAWQSLNQSILQFDISNSQNMPHLRANYTRHSNSRSIFDTPNFEYSACIEIGKSYDSCRILKWREGNVPPHAVMAVVKASPRRSCPVFTVLEGLQTPRVDLRPNSQTHPEDVPEKPRFFYLFFSLGAPIYWATLGVMLMCSIRVPSRLYIWLEVLVESVFIYTSLATCKG